MVEENLELITEAHEFTAVDPTQEIKTIIERYGTLCTGEVVYDPNYVSNKHGTQ